MSVTLAIDTAGPRLQLALLGPGGTDISVDALAQGHAELIFPRIATLLERQGLAYSELTRIGVTAGPGSFTGLRIGLSAARGLGLALGIPVLGIPTLFAISLAAPPEKALAVLLDARRDEAYVQHFAGPADPDGPARLLPTAEARGLLRAGETLIEDPFCDIARLAIFAAGAAPEAFPPEPNYLRGADARPQEGAIIARQPA